MSSILKSAIAVICTVAATYFSCAFIAWDWVWVAATGPFIRALALLLAVWLSLVVLMVINK